MKSYVCEWEEERREKSAQLFTDALSTSEEHDDAERNSFIWGEDEMLSAIQTLPSVLTRVLISFQVVFPMINLKFESRGSVLDLPTIVIIGIW